MARLTPQELKAALARGLLAFPLTDFDAADALDTRASAARLEWLAGYRPAAFFMAGGAGEFFSLTAEEYAALIASAAQQRAGGIPILGAAGYGTRMAVALPRRPSGAGADGLLLLPPYLTEAPQEGLRAHIEAVCKATRIGVVVYNRANCRLQAETLARLAEACPNLIGFKDGIGDAEQIMRIRAPARRPARLSQRHADGRDLRPRLRGAGLRQLLLGHLQLRAAHGHRGASRRLCRRRCRPSPASSATSSSPTCACAAASRATR